MRQTESCDQGLNDQKVNKVGNEKLIEVEITTKIPQTNTKIDIEYKTVTFNEDLSFPYSVPEGYERIYIDKI